MSFLRRFPTPDVATKKAIRAMRRAPFAAGTFRANRRTVGFGSGVQLEFKFLLTPACVCKLRIRDGRGFMKDHLLSLVRGRQGHFRLRPVIMEICGSSSRRYACTRVTYERLLLNSRHNSRSIRLKWHVARSSRAPLSHCWSLLNSVAISHTPNASRIQRARGYIRSSTVSRELCSQP